MVPYEEGREGERLLQNTWLSTYTTENARAAYTTTLNSSGCALYFSSLLCIEQKETGETHETF